LGHTVVNQLIKRSVKYLLTLPLFTLESIRWSSSSFQRRLYYQYLCLEV